MSSRRLVTVLLPGLLTTVVTVVPVGAQSATYCTGTDVIRINPGLSMSTPTSGTLQSEGGKGTEECHGPVDGYEPTGSIKVVHSAIYGYIDPDTCGALEAKAFAVHSLPTAKGEVEFTNHFTASFKPLSDGLMAGSFKGDHFSGRFTLRPLEGDCITAPLTLFEGIWEGTWHGTGSPPPAVR
jgi:hypothetical protein